MNLSNHYIYGREHCEGTLKDAEKTAVLPWPCVLAGYDWKRPVCIFSLFCMLTI